MISIVSPTDLLNKIQSDIPRLRLVDARRDFQTEPSPWPGAIRLHWEDFCAKPENPSREILLEPGYWGTLQDNDLTKIAGTLSQQGLSNDDEIVVFADGLSAKGREGRIAWMLAYLGGKNISILDGYEEAWTRVLSKGEIAAARQKPSPSVGNWQIDLAKNRRCTMPQLKALKDSGKPFVLVDTRSKKEFIGESYDYQPRLGHIPGAVLFSFRDFYSEDGNFIDKDKYVAKMAALADIPDSVEDLLAALQKMDFVSYCEVGVRAALLACLHEHYTGNIMSVYDGSIMEWGSHSELPVVMGECVS